MTRDKYTFSHRSDDGKTYYWNGPRIDSGSEVVHCGVEWFWNSSKGGN